MPSPGKYIGWPRVNSERYTDKSRNYEDEFFTIDMSKDFTSPTNVTRLRAVIQYLNTQFALQMRVHGAKLKISPQGTPRSEGRSTANPAATNPAAAAPTFGNPTLPSSGFVPGLVKTTTPTLSDDIGSDVSDMDENLALKLDRKFREFEKVTKPVTWAQAIAWVERVLERSRGRELPGNFNPLVIGQLFREQSQPWEAIAAVHVDRIASYCALFADRLLRHIAPKDISQKLSRSLVEPALLRRKVEAHQELRKILRDKQGDPITYNHYYTETIMNMRKNEERRILENAAATIRARTAENNNNSNSSGSLASFITEVTNTRDMNVFSAQEALTCEMAFYKVGRCVLFSAK